MLTLKVVNCELHYFQILVMVIEVAVLGVGRSIDQGLLNKVTHSSLSVFEDYKLQVNLKISSQQFKIVLLLFYSYSNIVSVLWIK